MRCIVLQCAAVCYSVLQCVAVCCSVLQWILRDVQTLSYVHGSRAGQKNFNMILMRRIPIKACVAVCCGVLQRVAVCCRTSIWSLCVASLSRSVLQCVAAYCSVLQCVAEFQYDPYASISIKVCVAVCCSVLQCIAVCCSVLQNFNKILMRRITIRVCVADVAVCCSAL